MRPVSFAGVPVALSAPSIAALATWVFRGGGAWQNDRADASGRRRLEQLRDERNPASPDPPT